MLIPHRFFVAKMQRLEDFTYLCLADSHRLKNADLCR